MPMPVSDDPYTLARKQSMLSFFFKKWKQVQSWIKEIVLKTNQPSVMTKHEGEQPAYKILCVDDDRSFCQFMRRLAQSLGVELDEAHSIEEAKQAIENHPQYQAFIVDGHLPDGSGFQIIAWIREKKKLSTPIGFISRIYQDSKSFRLLKESLAVDYVLEKPIRPLEVHQLLMELCQLKPQPAITEPFSDDILADLKASYQKTISDKVERLEKMILAIQKDPSIDHLQTLKGEVHKIAGSAGSYGYMAVSELCKNLELELTKQIKLGKRNQLNHQWLFSLDEFFTQVKLHFQMELMESDDQYALRARHLPSLYIVDEDKSFLNTLSQSKLDLRFDILIENRPEKAIQTLVSADFYPQLIFINAHYPSSIVTGYELMQAFYKKNDYLAHLIALMVQNKTLEEQGEALQRGMTFILTKPFSIPFLLQLLDQIPFRALPLYYKILIIDDDHDICQYILETLKYAGLAVKTIQDPSNLEATLTTVQPDLILLDLNLVDERGESILEKLRHTLKYQKLIVGMLTITQSDTSLIQKCYHDDVSEILFKPLEGGVLQRKIAYLLAKQTEMTLAVKKDPITGLDNLQTLERYLNELQHQHQTPFPKILVIFEVDDFASIDQKIKQEVLTSILQSLDGLFRKYDRAAYMGEGRFALTFQGYDPHFVQLFIRTFLDHLHSQLSSIVQDQSLCITEILVTLLPKEKADEILQRCERLLNVARQEQPDQCLRVMAEQSVVDLKEVAIFHDETEFPDVIKKFFEAKNFKVTVFTKWDNGFFQSIAHFPLMMLMGSFSEGKSLSFLKKQFQQSQRQIATLYLPHLPAVDELENFFEKIDYFKKPFSLILLIGA